ncbi:FAD dependent oxidoreductase-like protein [Pyrenochaeta sp. MPI-SDFR-AT-0127]|nr:FAD dependent oxidoreductase-like protein [Pyrenochaeta sp. MPI-SDFR-AT-0127]
MEARAHIPVGPPVANPLPSYWQDPKSPLANVIEPETDKPTEPYDYAIIGSGISGTMIAHNLLNTHPTARVVMLEAREICSGATGRNGGHTKAGSYRSYTKNVQELGKDEALKIARLEYANIVETHRLAEELKIDCENKLCDTVDVFYDQTAFDLGKSAIEALRLDASEEEQEHRQMAWYQVYEKVDDELRSFSVIPKNENPAVKKEEELSGAFKYLAGRVHAYRFSTGVLKRCVEKGLQLCANTPVHDIRQSTHGANDKAFWDIFTQYNTITAKNVILATNGYTPYLLKELQGIIVPMRGQITAQRPGKATNLSTPLSTSYSFIYQSGYEYMIPRPLSNGGQHIIIGGGLGRLPRGGSSEFGTVDDSSLNPNVTEYLRGSLTGYFGTENWGETSEEEASARIVQEWTGIMGATADDRPIVGEVPGKKGIWISAGFNGHGMVLCLKAAQALAKMVTEGYEARPAWFPESFLIDKSRLEKCSPSGETDTKVSV